MELGVQTNTIPGQRCVPSQKRSLGQEQPDQPTAETIGDSNLVIGIDHRSRKMKWLFWEPTSLFGFFWEIHLRYAMGN